MPLTAERTMEHIGETSGMQDHDRDLVHELDMTLNNLWRCDQYISNAEGKPNLQAFWKDLKKQQQETVDKLRALIREEIDDNCF